MEIHVRIKNQQYGPFSIEEIRKQLANGRLQPVDEAWHDGLPDWVTVREVLAVSEPMKVDIKSQNKPNLTPVYDKCPACSAPIQPTDKVCFRCTFQLDQAGEGHKRRARSLDAVAAGILLIFGVIGLVSCLMGFFIAEEGSMLSDPWNLLGIGGMSCLFAVVGANKMGWIGHNDTARRVMRQIKKLGKVLLYMIAALILLGLYVQWKEAESKTKGTGEKSTPSPSSVHNRMGALERDYVNGINLAGTTKFSPKHQKACDDFHEGLSRLDLSGCPILYKEAFIELINVVGDMKKSVVNKDVGKFEELDQKMGSIIVKLNKLVGSHGLQKR